MRVFLSFICSIALVSLAPEVHAGKHKDKKSSDSGAVSKPAQKAQAKSADWAGGVIAITALSLTLAAGITGMRVGGIRLGATLQMRLTPTTDRSMAIMV